MAQQQRSAQVIRDLQCLAAKTLLCTKMSSAHLWFYRVHNPQLIFANHGCVHMPIASGAHTTSNNKLHGFLEVGVVKGREGILHELLITWAPAEDV
jgi:hypothetical protein